MHPAEDDDRLAEILGAWRQACDRGEYVDPDEVIRKHPDVADSLRARFATLAALDEVFAESAALREGTPRRIGGYRLLREIGAGGMGTVHLAVAEDESAITEPGAPVALKLLHPHLLSRPGFFKRFLREAEIGKRLTHENVVRTLDVDASLLDGAQVTYLVMEYVEGRTLRDLLHDLGTVPEALLREIARQVVAGLAAIHEAGIVHRDLKPENVLITDDQRVRIMDLGVARAVEATDVVTHEGQFAGSLAYAAPEQFGKGEVGPRADLYALGVTLYELATGQNPFRRDHFGQVMSAHLHDVPARASARNEDVSRFFSEILATLLAKSPEERFASASAVASVLADAERSAWWRERESRVERVRRPRIVVRRETELYGREREKEALLAAWRRAVAGDGGTLLLEGEAGIGKTRLVDAFVGDVSERDAHVLYGSYPPVGGLGGLSDALVGHFGADALEAGLAEHLGVARGLAPGFAALLRHERPPEGAEPLRADAIHAAFCRVVQSLAVERPVVWVVDDLHFAAAEGRAVLISLARAVLGHRALIVATARPGLPESDLAHLSSVPAFTRVPLGRLSPREVVQLLRDAFGSEALAEKLGGRIAYKSDGIPFFVFEMIRGLKEGQFISELPDGTWVETRAVQRIEVPSAVRDLVVARLRDLTKEERAILDVGAVQGFEFRTDAIASVLERRRIAVLQDLAEMERRSGVVRSGGSGYRFDHHQIQEVLYDDLPTELRTEYHALVAEALAAAEGADTRDAGKLDGDVAVALCDHLLRGGRSPSALRYLDAAMRHLVSGHRHEAALALADRALAPAGLLDGAARLDLLFHKCERLERLGRAEAERDVLEEARRLATELADASAVARVEDKLGWHLIRAGRFEEAEQVLLRGLEQARASGDLAMARSISGNLGTVARLRGRLEEARARNTRHLELARETKSVAGELVATANLGLVAMYAAEHEAAMGLFRESLRLARFRNDRLRESNQLGNMASVGWRQGNYAEALELFEQQLEVTREIGYRAGESRAQEGVGLIASSQGRYADALAVFERNVALSRELGNAEIQANALLNVAEVLARLGCHQRAETALRESVGISQRVGLRETGAVACWSLSEIADHRGADDEAEALGCEAIGRLRELESPWHLGFALTDLGARLLRSGREAEARAALDEALAIGHDVETPALVCLPACLLAGLPGGDAASAARELSAHEQALEYRERLAARFALWSATNDPEHLVEAYRLLEFGIAHAPEDCRDSMIDNVPLHRDIMAAWREHGGSESETVVGT